MQINYVVLAIPVFLALIGIEALVNRLHARRAFHLEDFISNFGCGMLQQFSQVFLSTLFFAAHVWVYEHCRLFSIPATSALAWVVCFVAVDFLHYWSHRLGHEVAAFWAVHVVHHQSEEFNLTVPLRVSALDYYSPLFRLPLAVLGFPPLMYLALSSFVSIYGFWTHTLAVGRLGLLEWLLVTPSHHRLHHAQNPRYLDRNFGQCLIVWDRLFGTFVEGDEEPVFGITDPLRSWNPLWANVHYWVELSAKMKRTSRITDRLRLLTAKPGWNPPSLAAPDAISDYRPTARAMPAFAGARRTRVYVLVQFVSAVLATLALLNAQGRLSASTICFGGALVVATLAVCGGLLERRRWAWRLELLRVPLVAILALALVIRA